MPPARPLAEKFLYPKRLLWISNCIFNFNFLALVVSEILGGPKFALGGPAPPKAPFAEKFFHTHKYLPIYVYIYIYIYRKTAHGLSKVV